VALDALMNKTGTEPMNDYITLGLPLLAIPLLASTAWFGVRGWQRE
jgi:hypothetical protein